MSNEEILKQQVAALEKLLVLKDKIISELEKRPHNYYPYYPYYPYYSGVTLTTGAGSISTVLTSDTVSGSVSTSSSNLCVLPESQRNRG